LFWLEVADSFDPEFAAPEIDHGAVFVHVGEVAEGAFDEDFFSLMFAYGDSLYELNVFFVELPICL
jgi:hypothetical protein